MKAGLTRFSIFAVFAFALTTAFAAEPLQVPKRFTASIGGFLGSSYKVELRDGTLAYTSSGPGRTNLKQKTITPTATQWREFQRALDDLKVWEWRKEYPNRGIMDGTQWSLDIAFEDRPLQTHGDNCYPDDGGKPNRNPELTKSFIAYLAAIQKLLGGEPFQ
jgi:hypothetical protein